MKFWKKIILEKNFISISLSFLNIIFKLEYYHSFSFVNMRTFRTSLIKQYNTRAKQVTTVFFLKVSSYYIKTKNGWQIHYFQIFSISKLCHSYNDTVKNRINPEMLQLVSNLSYPVMKKKCTCDHLWKCAHSKISKFKTRIIFVWGVLKNLTKLRLNWIRLLL